MTGSDVSKGLGLESMIWLLLGASAVRDADCRTLSYINPDSPAGVYVDMDHNMVFMKAAPCRITGRETVGHLQVT